MSDLTPTPVVPAPAPTPPVSLQEAGADWARATTPEPVRNADGTFAPATPPVAPPATPTPATDTPLPAADLPPAEPATPAVKMIEAKVGEDVVPLRADTLIPMLRNGVVTYEPLEKVQREGLLKQDYDLKMRERKELDAQLRARELQLEARAKAFEAEEAKLRSALTSPEEFEQYQQHLQLMETSPRYKAAFEAQTQRDLMLADQTARQTVESEARVQDAISTATSWIEDAVGRHPGVDVDRVRERYGMALANGTARFDPADVVAIVEAEAAQLAKAMSPLQQQVEAMRAELAALKQNQTTTHALDRARAIPTGPLAGSPPAPTRQILTANGKKDLASMGDAWARGG